ncbi:choice-of-anchor D domain-containing protein, partial [Candidatus Albibeggiatoa sp. nov. BB20]|uniref:choice-of-anchor D domain-containing protein n=1 Tax=Candidatus Albibeggiatoa sp. nov. BB20 TaxID=3162723 RepID=UPI003365B054
MTAINRFLHSIKKVLPPLAGTLFFIVFSQVQAAAVTYSFVADQFVNGYCTSQGDSATPVHTDPYTFYFWAKIAGSTGISCTIQPDGFANKGSNAYVNFIVSPGNPNSFVHSFNIYGFDVNNTTGTTQTLTVLSTKAGNTISTQSHTASTGISTISLSVSNVDRVTISFSDTDGLSFNNFQLESNTEQAPVASSLNVSGSMIIGETLTGSHGTYSDNEGDLEGTPQYQWFSYSSASCGYYADEIAGATSATYTVTASDIGKYICFSVKPTALTGASPGWNFLAASAAVSAGMEIDVQGNAASISDGDTSPATADNTDFGTVTIGSNTTKTYAVKNTGEASLTLSGSPKVALSGAGCTEFSVTTQPTSPLVATTGSSDFSIQYTPTAVATNNCTVSIASDDPDENPYIFTITGLGEKLTQTITFGALSDKIYGNPDFSVSATASSSLSPSFATNGECSNTSSSISIDDVGSCTVTASQAGNATYYAATNVSQTFTIEKISQTITFGTLSDKIYEDADFSVSATASSGLSPSFATSGSCSNTGSSISIDDVGNCTVTVSQTGSAIYYAAPDVSQTFNVDKASQTISFSPSSTGIVGNSATLSASGGNSGNSIVFAVTTSATCSLSGDTLNYLNAGTCTVTANQAGTSQYYVAPEVSKSISITKAGTTTEFKTASPTPSALGQEVYIFFEVSSATGTTPTGDVTISSGNYSCSRTLTNTHNGNSGCFITFDEIGDYDFSISYAGDDNHYLSGNNKGLSHQVNQADFIYTIQQTLLSETDTTTSYTIELASIPTSVVNITITPDTQLSINDEAAGQSVSIQLLDITPVELTVTPVDDSILEGEHLGFITHSSVSDDANYDDKHTELSFDIIDNDAGVVITQTGELSEVIESGQANNYSIKLNTEPNQDVTINIETDSEQFSIYPRRLIFSRLNWNQSQNVRLLAVDDLEVEGNATATITHSISTEDSTYSAENIEFIIDEQSGNSLTVSIIDNDIAQAPLAPSNLQIALIDNQIQLNWQDNSYNETQFIVLKNQQILVQLPADSTSYVDTVQCGASYNYQIYATNEIGDSPVSNLATIDFPCPESLQVPLNFNVSPDSISQTQLTWQNNNQVEIGYQIVRNGQIIQNTASNTTNYTDTNLQCGTGYQYQIRAIGADLTVSAPATQTVTTLACEDGIVEPPEPELPPVIISPEVIVPTPIGSTPFVAPIVTLIKDNSSLERNANIGGQTVKNIYIQQDASIANGTLAGQISNEGLASNIVLAEGATMQGGSISGVNINHGVMQDATITLYSEISGGQFVGNISNRGTISDIELLKNAVLQGGKIGGLIQSQGTILDIQLQADARIIGGQVGGIIKGTPARPAYLGDIEILDGATLSYVRISPTTKLLDNVTIGEGVIFPKSIARPDLDDFGVDESELNSIDNEIFRGIESAAFSIFKPQHLQQLPLEIFTQFEAPDIAYLEPETVQSLDIEQFEQLPLETLAGFTQNNVDALHSDVLNSITPEKLTSIQPQAIQQAEKPGTIFTQLDSNKITPQQIQAYLPDGWNVDLETGQLIAPVGTKLNYKDLTPNNIPSQRQAQLPEIADLSTSFSLGGKTGQSAQANLNQGIKQTLSIGDVDLNQFIFTQNENGVLNIVGTGLYAGITFAFLPDVNDVEQAPLDIPVGLTQDAGGFFTMITPEQQRFVLTPSSNNPAGLVEVISDVAVDTEPTEFKGKACDFSDQVAKFNEDGDVLLTISKDKARRRTRAFETDVHMVAMFDAFVESAPKAFCNGDDCDWLDMPDNLQQGMHFPANLRALQQAYVVYP